jgi:hypothetical protein
MQQGKPQNHVTRGLEQRGRDRVDASSFPHFPQHLLDALIRLYPPRCLGPGERVEDHLRYAGKVDLIAAIQQSNDNRVQAADERMLADDQPGALSVEAG